MGSSSNAADIFFSAAYTLFLHLEHVGCLIFIYASYAV